MMLADNTHPSSELLIMSQISILRVQSSDTKLELVALSVKITNIIKIKCIHYSVI